MRNYKCTLPGLINQDEFVAMKTLSGCEAPRCDKHQFRDKMGVRT